MASRGGEDSEVGESRLRGEEAASSSASFQDSLAADDDWADLDGADDGQQAAEHELAATISAELEALREGGQPLTDGGRKEAEIVETSTAKATPTPGAPPQRDNGLLGDGEWFGLEEEDIEAAMEDMDAQLNQMFSSMRVQEQ
mmetsp:Transcript_30442/g.78203  ORF Transcript_30442/g.78203 Transcript_30442/m.78203 type:complete len:143 (-) Transcript_30442:1710-2138(-)